MKTHDRHVLVALLMAIVFLLVAVVAAAAEATSVPSEGPAVSREYFQSRDVQKWQANGTQGVWIQVADGRWLYATFLTPCSALPTSVGLRFQWSLAANLRVGASVKTAAGAECAVGRIAEVAAAGSTTPIEGASAGTGDEDLEGVVVTGRESKDVPRCGVRAIVWALTRPGSAWRLVTPVEDVGPATACLPGAASDYRWTSGIVP